MAEHVHYDQKSFEQLNFAVITISDTRTIDADESGELAVELIEGAGYSVKDRLVIPDDPKEIRSAVRERADSGSFHVILTSGGTGIASRDNTVAAIEPLLERSMPGFGELFRSLSYEEIGARSMLSRAFAGVLGGSLVFCLPGSPSAVRLGLEKLILPDVGHLVWEVTR